MIDGCDCECFDTNPTAERIGPGRISIIFTMPRGLLRSGQRVLTRTLDLAQVKDGIPTAVKRAITEIEEEADCRAEQFEAVDLATKVYKLAHEMGFNVAGQDPADDSVRQAELAGRKTDGS